MWVSGIFTTKPRVLVLICTVILLSTTGLSIEQNSLSEERVGMVHQAATSIDLGDVQLVLPAGSELFSIGLDRDYKNVVTLRYILLDQNQISLTIIVRQSDEPQDWKLPNGAKFVKDHGLPTTEEWIVYEASNPSLTEKRIAGIYNKYLHVKVIAAKPMDELRRLIKPLSGDLAGDVSFPSQSNRR